MVMSIDDVPQGLSPAANYGNYLQDLLLSDTEMSTDNFFNMKTIQNKENKNENENKNKNNFHTTIKRNNTKSINKLVPTRLFETNVSINEQSNSSDTNSNTF